MATKRLSLFIIIPARPIVVLPPSKVKSLSAGKEDPS